MSNHYSAANLKFRGDDARLDFTDLFVFSAPDDPGMTVLIIDANPYTTGMSAMPPFLMKSEFHPDGIYREERGPRGLVGGLLVPAVEARVVAGVPGLA